LAKPIQETIFKSRLTITYRTNISGTMQQESLPYRLLVLGEFSGKAMRADRLLPDLAEREVKSIKRGTTVNDHLRETMPIWRIPANLKALQSAVPGNVTFSAVTCDVPIGAIERNEAGKFALSGTATFTSTLNDNGLCDMEGLLRIGGTMSATIKGGVVTADGADIIVSGALANQYADPATGKTAGVVTAFIETTIPVKAGLTLAPNDEIEPSPGQPPKTRQFVLTLDPVPVAAERTVPFPSIEAFSPDAIAASIPELHRLQVIKQLIVDLQSGLRNRPELRKLLKATLPAYGASPADAQKKLEPVVGLKSWAEAAYPLLKIERAPTPKPKPKDGDGNGGGDDAKAS
jgi:predicted component of type VI protein secretion system